MCAALSSLKLSSLVGALALLASACGGAAPTATPTRAPATAAPVAPTATPAPRPVVAAPTPTVAAPAPSPTPAAVARRAPAGKVALVLPDVGSESLDPAQLSSNLENPYRVAIFDSLITISQVDGTLKGGLAASWKARPGGLGWEFTLRRGVTMHDGSEFIAEDVKFSSLRALDPKEGVIRPDSVLSKVLDRYEAADKYTLLLITKEPYVFTPYVRNGGAYPKAYFEKVGREKFRDAPVGPGPYKLVERRRSEFMRLTAFDRYYGNWDNVQPDAKDMEIRIVPEASTRMAMLKTGEADITSVEGPQVAQARALPGVKLFSSEAATQAFIAFFETEVKGSPQQDVRVRRALNHAVDRKALIEKLFYGEAVPARTAYIAKGVLGHDETLPQDPYPYNPELAKRLLAEAGYPNGFIMDFNVRQRDQYWAEAVASMWVNIGVKTNFLVQEIGSMNNRWWAKQLKGVGAILGTTAPDQTGYIFAFLANGQTWSYYNDAYLNDATARLYTTVDSAAREQLTKDIGRYMAEKAINVFIIHGNFNFAGGPRVESWPVMPGVRDAIGLERIKLRR